MPFYTTYNLCFIAKTVGLIVHIDCADAAIRRNISFFRESKFVNGSGDDERYHKRCELSLKSIADIIRTIYAEVKTLESFSLPDYIEAMYEPLEDLFTCVYFQKSIDEFSSDDIKSQYLMRLCLMLLYAQADSLNYLNDINKQFQKHLAIHIEKLSNWLNDIVQPQKDQNTLVISKTDYRSDYVDLLRIKISSMDVLCRLIAATNQYQNTDQKMQRIDANLRNKTKMLELSIEMSRTKECLCGWQDDFQTIQLIYNKYLVQKFEIPIKIEQKIGEDDKDQVNLPERIDKNVEIAIEEDTKEYFGIRDDDSDSGDENEDGKVSRVNWQDELENIDMKVTRSFFAPVLKQLNTKIHPIKTEMKEREMKFLMSKGIDREKIIESDKNEENQARYSSSSDTDTSDSADSYEKKRKSKLRPDRYNEMRSFLEQKQPIRFMPLANLPSPPAAEDVLE